MAFVNIDDVGPEHYKKLDYFLPEEIDAQVRDVIPDLFSGKYKTVLYVGANHLRQHFLPDFIDDYEKVTVIEIFEANVAFLQEKFADYKINIMQGDVRNVDNLVPTDMFDVCFWWHGPEHVSRGEVDDILARLERQTKSLIVLGMPYGHYEQGSEYGNDHECHTWDIYPKYVEVLGYSTNTIGKPDDTLSNMMAWKYL